ncbi:hypothetical protein JXR93_11365, partial [bacterium]|nr:hypothetical protein [bacterium]
MIRLTLFLLILLSTILYSESIQGVINSRVFLSACDLNISPKTKYSWSLTSAPESVINNLSENSLIESLDFSCLASFKTDIVGNYLVKVVAVDLIVNQIKEKEFNIDIFENLEKNNYNFNLYKKGLKERYSIEYLNDLDNEIVSPEKKDQSIEVCFNDLIAFKEIFGEATIKIQNLSDKTDEVISSKNRVYLYKNQLYSLSILYFDSNIYKTIIYENYYPEDFLNIFSSENREVSNQKTESPEISIYSNNIKIRGIFTYFFESSKYSTIYPTLYSSEENFEI